MGMEVNNSRLAGMDQNVQSQTAQTGQAPNNDTPKATHGKGEKPASADVDAFESLMTGSSEKTAGTKLPSAENLFAGMFGMQQPQDTGQPMAQVSQAGPVTDPDAMDSMVSKLVDRILVSEPGKGQQEVRMTFNDAALKGTEVTLSRSLDGQLMVKLNTTDPASYQTLVGAQDSLRAALERNGQNVRVEANFNTSQQDNDSNQRSSTYQEYTQDEA